VGKTGALAETRPTTARPGVLGLGVIVHRPTAPPVKYRFEGFWNAV
jgi:hypothetical protein